MNRIQWRIAVTCVSLTLLAEAAAAQEMWKGRWVQTEGAQGGQLEFLLTSDGMINGNITNGGLVGLWSGFIRDDGLMFAEYAYPYQQPRFVARAIGRVLRQAGNHLIGRLVFVHDNKVFAQGQFELTRRYVPPQQVNPRGNEYPFTGNGMYVYCAAPSICGERGGNTLPGNWGWTSGLFNDIKQNYPHVYCNLYPGSCGGR
jgi:hypothetical protein